MKTRTIHELLIVLYTHIENNIIYVGNTPVMMPYAGLCTAGVLLCNMGNSISNKEYVMLDNYLNNNLPKRCYEYTKYCWKPRYWTHRRKWLQKQIELTKP